MSALERLSHPCADVCYSGVFHIAEVTSRLISNKDFIKLVESFGFHLEEHVREPTLFRSKTNCLS